MRESHINAPLIGSLVFSFKHLQSPWRFFSAMMNIPTHIKLRGEKEIQIFLHHRQDFWRIRNLMNQGWKILQANKNLVYVKKGDLTICGKFEHLGVLYEPLEKFYQVFDYKNKTVLDVGGYIGYSAVLFSKWGAKKIIIYEAQKNLASLIRKNLHINNVNGEVYELAVSDKDGDIELSYTELGTTTVGLYGDKKCRVKSKSISKILVEHSIDIAKFDCEGCEYSLLSVPCDILRRVPKYVIEYHRGFEPLKKKFEECGYCVKHLWKLNSQIGGFKAEVKV